MASTRLRKAFRYPGDENDTDPVEGIDEQEQDEIIRNLARADAASSTFYRQLLLAMPAGVAILYLVLFLTTSTIGSVHQFQRFLCMTSVFLSAAPLVNQEVLTSFGLDVKLPERYVEINRFVKALNAGICAMLCLIVSGGYLSEQSTGPGFIPAYMELAPALVCFLVALIADQELSPIDVGELERARYEYKGA